MKWIEIPLNKYRVVRITVLGIATLMTWAVSEWSMWFATGNSRNGMEIAAILAAVQAPVMGYAGWAFKVYVGSRTES